MLRERMYIAQHISVQSPHLVYLQENWGTANLLRLQKFQQQYHN